MGGLCKVSSSGDRGDAKARDLVATLMPSVRWSPNTAWVELPSRNAGPSRGGRLRAVAMLGSTCSSRSARGVQSLRWLGVCGPSAPGTLGVGVALRPRARAAVAASTRTTEDFPRVSAPRPHVRAASRAARLAEKAAVERATLHRRFDAARAERARDQAERMRIADAQAAERARVDAALAAELARSEQLQAERACVNERKHAREAARCARMEASRAAMAAAAAERERDAAAWLAAERAVDARWQSSAARFVDVASRRLAHEVT